MEIIYVNHSTILGGGEISLLNLLGSLDQDQYHPLVILPGLGPLTERLSELDVEFVTLPISMHTSPGKFARGVWNIKKQTSDVQIVHGSSTRSLRVAVVLGKLFGASTIWHVRDRVNWERLPRLERWFARQADIVIANSAAVAQRLGPLSVQVAHNPVDTTLFCPEQSGQAIRKELGIAAHEKLVGVVGRITVWKGHQTFIEALSYVRNQVSGVKAVIVGEEFRRSAEADQRELEGIRQTLGKEIPVPSQVAYQRHELEQLVHELGLDGQVIFTGFRPDIPMIMAALDLLVLPSWWEPFGRVLIEAMACATPVVATNLGGVPEIVQNGKTGLLVPPLDPQAMASAMCKVLTQPELAARLASEARLEVERRFSLSGYVDQIKGIYQRVSGS
jgi:glycosyltransferase involved in cell wall biosynthesis